MNARKPDDFPYPSRYADVLGSKMHYVEHGAGDPILFLHGQPTWSYLWRRVLPELEGKGRLIAVDLIGYGLSDRPDIDYGISDHVRYLDAFIDKLGLDRLTLVIHDWGSFFGFHYARRHPERIKGLAFMEALLFPIPGYEAFDPETREFFQTLRASQQNAERMMVDENQFIEGILPAMTVRALERHELDAYRAPWADPAARRILCKFPQNLCIGGEPAEVCDAQTAYMDWLQKTDLPKLLVHADPGLLISPDTAVWYRDQLPNTETASVGPGLHYIQEDRPREIGAAIAEWMGRHGL
ncbi:MAG: haloalkane dehalogenase [Wenzhouxiangellaceae bacterium]|nr:haloalkane dehalogenase [Wenzhouxiangellaceae bacterium]